MPGCTALKPASEVSTLLDISNTYVIEKDSSTKLGIKRFPKNTYCDDASSKSDFSADSSNNYEPSSDEESLNSETEKVGQELPNILEATECKENSPNSKKGKQKITQN
ncbi:unnamed protein product [Psylliodes chrysocephalus]|uniref:Uncharacterized protein n=1 Tax=Psylliodes chrysocephalus TaxID=3402493 RepID=A0A9P0GH45_9CUCU|nr:unnamed protein product [Psylliodes chrysocephala]